MKTKTDLVLQKYSKEYFCVTSSNIAVTRMRQVLFFIYNNIKADVNL